MKPNHQHDDQTPGRTISNRGEQPLLLSALSFKPIHTPKSPRPSTGMDGECRDKMATILGNDAMGNDNTADILAQAFTAAIGDSEMLEFTNELGI